MRRIWVFALVMLYGVASADLQNGTPRFSWPETIIVGDTFTENVNGVAITAHVPKPSTFSWTLEDIWAPVPHGTATIQNGRLSVPQQTAVLIDVGTSTQVVDATWTPQPGTGNAGGIELRWNGLADHWAATFNASSTNLCGGGTSPCNFIAVLKTSAGVGSQFTAMDLANGLPQIVLGTTYRVRAYANGANIGTGILIGTTWYWVRVVDPAPTTFTKAGVRNGGLTATSADQIYDDLTIRTANAETEVDPALISKYELFCDGDTTTPKATIAASAYSYQAAANEFTAGVHSCFLRRTLLTAAITDSGSPTFTVFAPITVARGGSTSTQVFVPQVLTPLPNRTTARNAAASFSAAPNFRCGTSYGTTVNNPRWTAVLPAGFTINIANGFVSGTAPSTAQTFNASVTCVNNSGAVTSSFTWTIT